MTDLSTTYMGLHLSNPIVVASSGLTTNLKGVKKCAEAGAGAIVLKSLFEEQLAAETRALGRYADYVDHGEAAEYLASYGMALGPRDYLRLVSDAKQEVKVPIIASINCVTDGRWGDYALQLEGAGADAIELNVALMPTDPHQEGAAVEEIYFRILHEVKSRVGVPVALKIGPHFTALARIAERLTRDRVEGADFSVGWCGGASGGGRVVWRGADALVLFNRFLRLDIDLETLELVAGNPYSTPEESHTTLRWISLLAGRIDGDLAAATGIHDGRDIARQILAGATTVQVCSTLYRHGLGQIGRMRGELEEWMDGHGFSALGDFRGRLSQARSERPHSYERLQYLKLFGGG